MPNTMSSACSCCGPVADHGLPGALALPAGRIKSTTSDVPDRMRQAAMQIPGGMAEVGTDQPYLPEDGESPKRLVRVKPFRLSPTTVTNAEFAAFVDATGYVTDAEKFGWSFVFYQYVEGVEQTQGVVGVEWWRRVEGAFWRASRGPGSTMAGLEALPVVHVSWSDAVAFAAWAGGRLPTEIEWEHAARGGLSGSLYPWGNEHPGEENNFFCNIWQGKFPDIDSGADGFRGLAPAQSFAANGYGLFNMAGNCWEWTSDAFRVRSLKRGAKERNAAAVATRARVLKGGSHLCHASYCHRYRIAARTSNTPDTSTGHIGFRVAFDA
jgi:sulfatase modifying factor 1